MRVRWSLLWSLAFLAVSLMLAGAANAQFTGNIDGVVTDPSGGTIAGGGICTVSLQVTVPAVGTYNNTSGITYFPGNSYNPAGDWALSDNDRRHKFDLLASSQPTRYFTVGAALSVYSGKPVNITTGADNNHDGVVNDRPAGVPRNAMPGPGTVELDLNLAHDFMLSKSRKEARTLTVSLNSFNVLNHVNDMTYIGTITSPFFGHAVAAQPPRRMQLDVQFKF